MKKGNCCSLISRSATIVVNNHALCLSINQDVFKDLLAPLATSVRNKRISIMQGLKLFNFWSHSTLARLTSFILLRKYPKGTYIYKEGEFSNYVYIVVEGEVEIVKELITKSHLNLRGVDKYSVHKTKPEKVETILMKVSRGNSFGNEEGFGVHSKEYSTRVVSNECLLYLLPEDVKITIKG